jgi:hypothetical protein
MKPLYTPHIYLTFVAMGLIYVYVKIDATNAMGDPNMDLGTVKNDCVLFVSKLTQILLKHCYAVVMKTIYCNTIVGIFYTIVLQLCLCASHNTQYMYCNILYVVNVLKIVCYLSNNLY